MDSSGVFALIRREHPEARGDPRAAGTANHTASTFEGLKATGVAGEQPSRAGPLHSLLECVERSGDRDSYLRRLARAEVNTAW